MALSTANHQCRFWRIYFGAVPYGGILRFELHCDRVRVRFDDRTAAKIGGESEIEVRFNVDPDKLQELAAALETVFVGQSCFVDCSRANDSPELDSNQKG
jgi:hypothetical protein